MHLLYQKQKVLTTFASAGLKNLLFCGIQNEKKTFVISSNNSNIYTEVNNGNE